MADEVADELTRTTSLEMLDDYRSEVEVDANSIVTSGVHALSSTHTSSDFLEEELRVVNKLNKEAFPALMLGKVDDLLVHSFFKHKTRKHGSSWFRPSTLFPLPPRSAAQRGSVVTTSKEIQNEDSWSLEEQGKAIGKVLARADPDLFPSKSQSCIDHLATRYLLVWHGPHEKRTKRLAICRFVDSGSIIARRAIPADTLLHELCGSMSSDVVIGFDVDESVFPMMQAQESQLGPTRVRLLLGPFRFVQHDCKPNCKVVAIEGTHAYGVQSMRDIQLGEFLTVDRAAGKYKRNVNGEQTCRCRSCDAPRTLEADARGEKIKKRNRTRSLARKMNKKQKLETEEEGRAEQEAGTVEETQFGESLAES